MAGVSGLSGAISGVLGGQDRSFVGSDKLPRGRASPRPASDDQVIPGPVPGLTGVMPFGYGFLT